MNELEQFVAMADFFKGKATWEDFKNGTLKAAYEQ